MGFRVSGLAYPRGLARVASEEAWICLGILFWGEGGSCTTRNILWNMLACIMGSFRTSSVHIEHAVQLRLWTQVPGILSLTGKSD